MALLKIARMGHPVLVHRAEPVPDPAAPEVRRLVEDMIETMLDADGVGLAAPQVHVPWRLFVFRVPERRAGAEEDHDEDHDGDGDGEPEPAIAPTVIVNPLVESIDDEVEIDFEGCLSIPGMRGLVPRPANIRYRGFGLDGRPVRGEARGGLHARVIQHEYDHLEGILFPMRMPDLSLLGFSSEVERHAEELLDAADLREKEIP
ncbi:MAG: peptide deformylase [Acetobacterales bacterium]